MGIDDLPPHEQFWERPPSRDQGDGGSEAIHTAQGVALGQWELLESWFASFFMYLIQSKSLAARRAYGSIASARGRRDALMAAAEVFFADYQVDEENQKRFKKLMSHFGCASGRRNEIAHGFVLDIVGHGCFLVPADYNTSKNFPQKQWTQTVDILEILTAKYRYASDDIKIFARHFHSLEGALFDYIEQLQKLYPPR
jgi:hypothetical protein